MLYSKMQLHGKTFENNNSDKAIHMGQWFVCCPT